MDELVAYTVQKPRKAARRYFVHNNSLYSPQGVTDVGGAVVERYTYDAYGRQSVMSGGGAVLSQSAVGMAKGFTGQAVDAETGMMYFRARMYSPGLGRFISRDPIGYKDGYGLYGAYFVPNTSDPMGTETYDVNKCNILIVWGHQNYKDPVKFEFKDDKCAAAGFIGCKPSASNPPADSPNAIPGAPRHPQVMGTVDDDVRESENKIDWRRSWAGRMGEDEDGNPVLPEHEDMQKAFELLKKNAESKARAMTCCKTVRITIRYSKAGTGTWPYDDLKGTYPKEQTYEVSGGMP